MSGDVEAAFRARIDPLALDVTDAAVAETALTAAKERFGVVDVIVDKAGYANVAPIETGSDDDRKWAAVGRSADFAERCPVEFPTDRSS